MISEEISSQMSRKLNEIKNSLNFQIKDAISSAISEKILPFIQNTLETQGRVNYIMMDRGSVGLQGRSKEAIFIMGDQRSGRLQRNSEVENAQKSWENRPRKCFIQENDRLTSRQSSVESDNSEQNRDMVTGANLTPHMVPEFPLDVPYNPENPCNVRIPTMMSLRIQSPKSLGLQHQLLLLTPLTV